MTNRILALWSAPRSRSTAFLRMMVERGDHAVLHEPFSHLVDFGAATVDGAEMSTEDALIAAIRALAIRTPVFFKDTTDFRYPGLLADTAFQRDATHTFIIRHPAAAIASHFALNPDLPRDDVGFARLHEIFEAVWTSTGRPPVVLESDDLVSRPGPAVRAYCDAVGLPFASTAISWRPSVMPEWERTRRWHEATSRTSGFVATSAAYEYTVDNHPVLAGYLEYHLPYYEKLYRHRLVIEETGHVERLGV